MIERDVQAAIAAQPKLTPVAQAMVQSGGYALPGKAAGLAGVSCPKIWRSDGGSDTLEAPEPAAALECGRAGACDGNEGSTIPLRGVRKVIADRMLQSMQSTAQLTLNRTADAAQLLAYRQQLKGSPRGVGLQEVTINDLVLFAVTRTLPRFPALNALFSGDAIQQYAAIHLGFAVDTPRGLIVPVLRNAQALSLRQLAAESRGCPPPAWRARVLPDELSGGTFTVTNLGSSWRGELYAHPQPAAGRDSGRRQYHAQAGGRWTGGSSLSAILASPSPSITKWWTARRPLASCRRWRRVWRSLNCCRR